MTNSTLYFYYQNNLPWACTDVEECPTHIRQILITTQEKALEVMETPNILERERPWVAKAIKERQEVYDLKNTNEQD